MDCKIGDTVRFLNDVGGGKIAGFAGKNQVLVEDEDGFQIPVLMSEIVVVSTTGNENKEEVELKISPVQKTEEQQYSKAASSPVPMKLRVENDTDDYEIILAFLPVNQQNPADGDIDMYIINDSSYYLLFSAGFIESGTFTDYIKGGELEPDTKQQVKRLKVDELSTIQQLSFGLMMYRIGSHRRYEPEEVQLELNPIKFFRANAFTDNDYFEEKVMLYKLSSSKKTLKDFLPPSAEEIANAMKEKKSGEVNRFAKKNKQVEIEEVDLHIQVLADDYEKLDSGEILDIQLSRFITSLDLGLRSGTKRMVFIHGVGNGKLKREILRLLDTQYAGKVRYQDASFKEYGYGATMVML